MFFLRSTDGESCAEGECTWDDGAGKCTASKDPCESLSELHCNSRAYKRMCMWEDKCVDECSICKTCIDSMATVAASDDTTSTNALAKVGSFSQPYSLQSAHLRIFLHSEMIHQCRENEVIISRYDSESSTICTGQLHPKAAP